MIYKFDLLIQPGKVFLNFSICWASIFAIHRVLVFEAPTMGWSFVTIRLISCALLPILAGLIVELLSIDGLNVPSALAF